MFCAVVTVVVTVAFGRSMTVTRMGTSTFRPPATGSRATRTENSYVLPGINAPGGNTTLGSLRWYEPGVLSGGRSQLSESIRSDPAPELGVRSLHDHTYVNGNAAPCVSLASSGSSGATSSARGASAKTVRWSPVSRFGTIGELDTRTVTI